MYCQNLFLWFNINFRRKMPPSRQNKILLFHLSILKGAYYQMRQNHLTQSKDLMNPLVRKGIFNMLRMIFAV